LSESFNEEERCSSNPPKTWIVARSVAPRLLGGSKMDKKLKVLLIVDECNPEFFSFPLAGYNFFQSISRLADVTLVTHERNEGPLKKVANQEKIIYIRESVFVKKYFQLVLRLTMAGRGNVPLKMALAYPLYAEFNHKVYRLFKDAILRGDYDIVHAITPGIPRYPYKEVRACQRTPFLLGPVNGGLPFPKGFEGIARLKAAHFNFLRAVGRVLIPGYAETYKKANLILAGSKGTRDLLKKMFKIPDNRIRLFSENGVPEEFFLTDKPKNEDGMIRLLFVGRLVPYKCADIVIEAVSRLAPSIQSRIILTIVGYGFEKERLEKIAKQLCLDKKVLFHGKVLLKELVDFYRRADIFCFPSIREYGGGGGGLEGLGNRPPFFVTQYGGKGE